MILTTHSIVGAAIVSVIPAHPILGLTLAFGSHFVLDAIPHWEYKILSNSINPKIGGDLKIDKNLIKDLFRIGGDAILGIILSAIIFFNPSHPWLFFFGACAGMIPDFLQFFYLRLPYPPLSYLQQVHRHIHSKYKIENLSGALWQALIILLASF